MPECRRKVSPASVFLPVVSCLIRISIPGISGIRVQSGTAGHGLVRHCPAMVIRYHIAYVADAIVLSAYVLLLVSLLLHPSRGRLLSFCLPSSLLLLAPTFDIV